MSRGIAWATSMLFALAGCADPSSGLGDGGGSIDARTATDAQFDALAAPDALASPDTGLPAEPEPDTDIGDPSHERWFFMQSHLHTTGFHACANDPIAPGPLPDGACFTSEGITAFLDEALLRGASDMIITDHNNVDAWFDVAFAPLAEVGTTRYATPLRGTEWSSGDGHMTLLFPSEVVADNAGALANGWIFEPGNDTMIASIDDYRAVIDSVHAASGVAIINHPELYIHVFPEASAGADGVEVGIPPNPLDDVGGGAVSLHTSAEARRFWQRRLVAGDRLAGTAGADHHHGGGDIPGLEAPTFGIAVNLVRADPSLPDFATAVEAIAAPATAIDRRSAIVTDALRRGHVMVVEDEEGARVFAGADVDGDGRFHDAREGDCVRDEEATEITVRVRLTDVSGATGTSHYNLQMWTEADDADPVLEVEVDYDDGFAASPAYRIDPSDPFAIEMDVPVDPSAPGFVRFVLEREIPFLPNDTEAVTNPIYFGDWNAECASASPQF